MKFPAEKFLGWTWASKFNITLVSMVSVMLTYFMVLQGNQSEYSNYQLSLLLSFTDWTVFRCWNVLEFHVLVNKCRCIKSTLLEMETFMQPGQWDLVSTPLPVTNCRKSWRSYSSQLTINAHTNISENLLLIIILLMFEPCKIGVEW